MLKADTVLQDRYRIERQIGQGGMGAVYIATDERFGSTVAIKETLFLDEKFRKAFEREARLLNSLRHSALPRVSDHFVDGNGQFLVMEYIDGEDLSEMMEHEGKAFALADVLNWTDQLLDALDFLHTREMPVIHRDIKPQNLKLTKRGEIILLDFGLAKGNPTNPESATAAKSVFGYSRNYASLEQIQGTGTDPRSDLYSLAATMYHLVTGVPPADALTRAMNVLSEKEDPLVGVSEINKDVPLGVAEVLTKAMALNANQRPISAKAMRTLLHETEIAAADELKTVAHKRLDTNIFTQKTAVLPVPTAIENREIATEVIPADAAAETAVKPRNTGDFDADETRVMAAQSEGISRRKFAIAATAFGALVLAGTAAAAIFIYNPGFFDSGTDVNGEQKVDSVTIANTETNATSAEEVVPAAEASQNESETRTNIKQNPQKQTETSVKNTTTQKTDDQQSQSGATAAGDAPPKPQLPNFPQDGKQLRNRPPQIPPDVWERMTQEQREKMRRAMEMQKQQERQNRRERPPPPPN